MDKADRAKGVGEFVVTDREENTAELHIGHRKRVRERFRKNGLECFAPHEVLELLLFYSRPRGDVNVLAHQLLRQFGSLHSVLEAGYEQLVRVPGVGEETATLLSVILPVFRCYAEELMREQKAIRNRTDALQYCVAMMVGRRNECLFAIFLNSGCQVIANRIISEGSLSEVSAYPRVIAGTALDLNAKGIILCHNHPGGSVVPSNADVEATRKLEVLLETLDIALLDHIIVAGETTYSMTQQGIIRQDQTNMIAYKNVLEEKESTGAIVPKEYVHDRGVEQ